jgi:hypothetical protein
MFAGSESYIKQDNYYKVFNYVRKREMYGSPMHIGLVCTKKAYKQVWTA